jgi:branched-chain amino acid transport system substrate-binding protein
VVALGGCGPEGGGAVDGPVTVYVSLPLTGPRSGDGRDAADGARLALEQAGGKAGDLAVEANFLDDANGAPWDPVAVGANARRAVQDSSAVAYIGELDSEPTRASLPITNNAGIVQVSPGAGGVDLTRPAAGYPDTPDRYQPSGDPTFARVIPADDVQAAAAASWASDLKAKRAAVDSSGSAFDELTAEEFSSSAEELGIEIVSAPERADAVFEPASQRLLLGPPGEGTLAVSAALDPSRLPSDQTGGSPAPPADSPRSFGAEFQARFGRAPGPYAAYGYEAMALVLQAIGDADRDTNEFRTEVRGGVIGAERRESVLGPYSITLEGDTTGCMIQRYRVRGGTPMPLDARCPPT